MDHNMYHVTFGERKKILKVNKGDDIVSEIKNKFQMTETENIMLQQYDDQYNDFVDLDNVEELPESCLKLKVILSTANSSFSSEPQSTQPQSRPQPTESQSTESLSLSESSHRAATSSSVASRQCFQTQSADEPTRPSTSSPRRLTWPTIFPVKATMFRHATWEKMSKSEKMDKSAINQIIEGLYEECIKYTYYPSKFQYHQMVTTLLGKFPTLSEGLSDETAIGLWKRRLVDKFKNTRRRLDSDVPEVAARKRKSNTVLTLNTKSSWGISNFLPEDNLDSDTKDAFKTQLKQQQRLPDDKRDHQRISKALDRTFAERRNFIVNQKQPVEEVLTNYPGLCQNDGIMKEFFRLTNKTMTFEEGLQKYANIIYNLPTKKGEPNVVKHYREVEISSKTESNKTYAIWCAALCLIPLHLKENLHSFILQEESTEIENLPVHPVITWTGPCITSPTKYFVHVEGRVIAESKCLLSTFAMLLASYYIFHIAYPTKMTSTLTFLQKAILDLADDEKKDLKVAAFLCKLHRLM